MTPDSLEPLLFDDAPFLEVARAEHDRFAQTLREQGAEVVYLEDLVREALDANPGARDAFTDQYLAESGVRDPHALSRARELLAGIDDTLAFVLKTMSGIRRDEVELSRVTTDTLASHMARADEKQMSMLIPPMPNLYFTRDPFAVVGDGVLVNHMYSVTRNRETIYGQVVFAHHPEYRDVPKWYRRDSSYHIEGGDVLNLNATTLAVGISQRTEAAAIDALAQNLFWGGTSSRPSEVDTIYAVDIPVSRACMHLDTVFTQIDVDTFTIYPAIRGTLQVFRLRKGPNLGEVRIDEMNDTLEHVLSKALGLDGVRVLPCGGDDPIAAAREQWNDGSNTLAVAPGRIVVYQRNVVTNELLYKAGLDLLVIPSSELSRGRGGPRCMSMPLWRDEAPAR
jgi:arginine deiminase